MPSAQHLISYHLVTGGVCWAIQGRASRCISRSANPERSPARQATMVHQVLPGFANTHALFAGKGQRKMSNGVAGLAAAGSDRPTPAQASLLTSWH
jgi:hypothetical protein